MDRKEYLLTCLMEECSEVIKNCSKAIRFGLDSEYEGVSNKDSIINEFTDVYTIMNMLSEEKYIDYLDNIRYDKINDITKKVDHFYRIHESLNSK